MKWISLPEFMLRHRVELVGKTVPLAEFARQHYDELMAAHPNPYEGCSPSVWCEKFGQHRDFTGGICGDADKSEDCRSCPANPNKGRGRKK